MLLAKVELVELLLVNENAVLDDEFADVWLATVLEVLLDTLELERVDELVLE